MRTSSAVGLLGATAVAMLVTGGVPPDGGDAIAAASRPACFERNDGQAPSEYRFLARHVEHEFAFSRRDVAIAVREGAAARVVRLRFEGARASDPIAEDPLAGRVNYLRGPDATAWVRDVPTYARIRYANVYDGIDAVFYASGPRVEYDFVVQPRANPSAIAMRFDGASSVRLTRAGDLAVTAGGAELLQRKPIAYQSRGGRRIPVAAAYRVGDDLRVTLALAPYHADEPLVIDPVIAYSTDYGGSAGDYLYGVAADGAGNLYAAGATRSANLPTTSGTFDRTLAPAGGNTSIALDAFIAKFSADGQKLIYATYLGGTSVDSAQAIAVDPAGNAYVAGTTSSFDFPVTATAFDRSFQGQASDGFVTKVNAAGNGLVYSSYLGDYGQDEPYGIALNGSGEAIVAGQTIGGTFPTTPGAFQQRSRGSQDGFVTKVSADGSALVFSTCYGGSGNDDLFALAVDAAGNVFVGGATTSPDLVTLGAFQPSLTPGGSEDGWVAGFTPAGSLTFASYLGGPGGDFIYGLSVSGDGIFAAGTTTSASLPGGTVARVIGAAAFITQIAPGGFPVLATRFIDGNSEDFVRAVVADSTRTVHVFGSTSSGNLPVTSYALQLKHAGPRYWNQALGRDTFYGTLPVDRSGTMQAPSYLTYLGGASTDEAMTMASDRKGGVYLGGSNDHHDFPLVNPRYRGNGGSDGFIAHVVPTSAFRVSDNRDMVLYAADWRVRVNDTNLIADPTSADGHAMLMPDRGAARVPAPAAYPSSGFDLQFYAIAGIPYRIWMRAQAQNNSTSNDSVWVQFSDSVDASGRPIWRLNSTSGLALVLEECSGCGVSGWGWHDDGWGVGDRGPLVYFARTGYHTVRFQQREDGLAIDQVIISSRKWLTERPGASRNSTNVYPRTIIP